MSDEKTKTSDDAAKRVDHVLGNLRSILLDDRMGTHGHPGLFAHTFAGMLRPFFFALKETGRDFADTDALAVLEMMKLARTATMPATFTLDAEYAHAEDAGGYAILRAAYSMPPAAVQALYAADSAPEGGNSLGDPPAVDQGASQSAVQPEKAADVMWDRPRPSPAATRRAETMSAMARTRADAFAAGLDNLARGRFLSKAVEQAEEAWSRSVNLVMGSGMTPNELGDPGNAWPWKWTPRDRDVVRAYLVSTGFMKD